MGGMSTEQIHRWELDWTFGDRLRKARRVLGITVDELARSLDVSKQAVSQWETGATIPRSVNAVARPRSQGLIIPGAHAQNGPNVSHKVSQTRNGPRLHSGDGGRSGWGQGLTGMA